MTRNTYRILTTLDTNGPMTDRELSNQLGIKLHNIKDNLRSLHDKMLVIKGKRWDVSKDWKDLWEVDKKRQMRKQSKPLRVKSMAPSMTTKVSKHAAFKSPPTITQVEMINQLNKLMDTEYPVPSTEGDAKFLIGEMVSEEKRRRSGIN